MVALQSQGLAIPFWGCRKIQTIQIPIFASCEDSKEQIHRRDGFRRHIGLRPPNGRLLEEELALLEAEVDDDPETAEGENDESSK